MSEIQHTNRAHARLNASSSHRWMMCPPSVKLSEQFEDKPSTYAEEGSLLHELCELKLHRYLGDMTAEAVEAQYAEHRDNEFYSDEAESVTDEYVAFCIETIEAVRSSCPDPLIMVEHRLDYSEYVPEGFGTGDLVIVADGVIEVMRWFIPIASSALELLLAVMPVLAATALFAIMQLCQMMRTFQTARLCIKEVSK